MMMRTRILIFSKTNNKKRWKYGKRMKNKRASVGKFKIDRARARLILKIYLLEL